MATKGMQTGAHPREERFRVVIPSRMRVDNWWTDVCIRNISAHGLLIASANPPARGSYVEIRRGTQIIVARAVWADGQFCGLRSQEALPVEQIITEPRLAKRPAVAVVSAAGAADRRRDDRRIGAAAVAERQDRSRRFAAAFQFVALAMVALGLSGWAAVAVYRLLAAPAASIGRALGG